MSEMMGRKIGLKKNFALESQQVESKKDDKPVIVTERMENGMKTTDLILEPEKFDELGSICRLSFEEYCDVINQLVEDEENDWSELRMKDQVNITRDKIIEATIMKYAKEEFEIKRESYNGSDLNYVKRYDSQGRFIGEAVIITLTSIAQMNMVVSQS